MKSVWRRCLLLLLFCTDVASATVEALAELPLYMQLGIREWMRLRLAKITASAKRPLVYFDIGTMDISEMLEAPNQDNAAIVIGFEPVVQYIMSGGLQAEQVYDHYLHIPAAVSRWPGKDLVWHKATWDTSINPDKWTAWLDKEGKPKVPLVNDTQPLVPTVRIDLFVRDLIDPFCNDYSIEVLKADTDAGELDALLSAGSLLGASVHRVLLETNMPSARLSWYDEVAKERRYKHYQQEGGIPFEELWFYDKPWLADYAHELGKLGYIEEKCFAFMGMKLLRHKSPDKTLDPLDNLFMQLNCVFVLPAYHDVRTTKSACFSGGFRSGPWLNVFRRWVSTSVPHLGEEHQFQAMLADRSDYELFTIKNGVHKRCCDGNDEDAQVCFESGLLDTGATRDYCCNWHQWYAFDVLKYGCVDAGNRTVRGVSLPPCLHGVHDWRVQL